MHHIPLDRAWADDGNLDYQIIKIARLHAWQEIHLRPAFHLKDADAVSHAQHVINLRVFRGQSGEVIAQPMMFLHQVKGLPDAGEHAKAQDVDFEDAKRVDVIFVPADDGAVFH